MFDYRALHDAVGAMQARRLFFIGGAVKSGTTWLQLLLNQHPDIACNGEGNFTNFLIPLLLQAMDDYNGRVAWKNEAVFAGLAPYPLLGEADRAYLWISAMALLLDRQAQAKPARVIGEKTPDNVRSLDLLHAAFPRAKFIQIVRDGRDAAVSNWFHNLRLGEEQTRRTFGTADAFFDIFAERWAGDLEAGTRFGDAHPDRYLAIRYEDLSADTAGTLVTLFRFLGVRSGKALAARCRDGGSFERLSGGRAPGQEDRNSFFRQGRPGDWRNHLDRAAADRFAAKAGRWLAAFGYA
jgi:hypothetical protein